MKPFDPDSTDVKSSQLISPDKPSRKSEGHTAEKNNKNKDKRGIPSFLQGFDFLSEMDMEILAQFEEEQERLSQTQFEKLFPTRETIDTLGKHFEC